MIISILQSLYNISIFTIGKLRARLLGVLFSNCGKNVVIMNSFTFRSPNNILIGNNTFINYGCFLDGSGGLMIGNDCQLAQNVSIFTANHIFERSDIPIKDQGYARKSVKIGDDIWIGANVIILPGVKIGRGCVIGAGAVVTKSIPAWSVVGGIPAKILKKRKR